MTPNIHFTKHLSQMTIVTQLLIKKNIGAQASFSPVILKPHVFHTPKNLLKALLFISPTPKLKSSVLA